MRKWLIPVLFTITAIIVSMVTYDRLPEQMAVHFGPSDAPNDWMGKPMGAFFLPALILFLCLIVWLGVKLEKDENKRSRVEASIGSILGILSATLLAVHLFIIAYNLGYELGAFTVTSVIVGIIFIFMGNLLPRLPQGSMQWPKLTEAKRRRATRFQGRMMITLGFLFLLLALLPSSVVFPIFFLMITIFIVTLVSSTLYFSRSE